MYESCTLMSYFKKWNHSRNGHGFNLFFSALAVFRLKVTVFVLKHSIYKRLLELKPCVKHLNLKLSFNFPTSRWEAVLHWLCPRVLLWLLLSESERRHGPLQPCWPSVSLPVIYSAHLFYSGGKLRSGARLGQRQDQNSPSLSQCWQGDRLPWDLVTALTKRLRGPPPLPPIHSI